ncbi:hypothetical protein CBM2637_B110518 [Cupriavidus taiwanensis]|nr:hypothetical protein CBM2637_B110518 [Cupriavidus taiwanensis]
MPAQCRMEFTVPLEACLSIRSHHLFLSAIRAAQKLDSFKIDYTQRRVGYRCKVALCYRNASGL